MEDVLSSEAAWVFWKLKHRQQWDRAAAGP
jgi:hypothetical protein